MKTIKYLFAFLIGFLILEQSVQALEEVFKQDWLTSSVETRRESYIIFKDKKPYQNGYIISSIEKDSLYYDSPTTEIIIYNNKGKKIKSNTFPRNLVFSLLINKGNIYAFSFNMNDEIEILRLNSDLKSENKLVIDSESSESIEYMNAIMRYVGIKNIITDSEDNILILVDEYLYKIDKDLNAYETIEINEDNVKDYFPSLSSIKTEENRMYFANAQKESKIAETGIYQNGRCDAEERSLFDIESSSCEIKGTIRLYENNTLKWSKDYEEYMAILNPIIINDYIIVNGMKDEENTEILILDMEGNIVQVIDEASAYYHIEGGNSSFIVTEYDGNLRCPMLSASTQSYSGCGMKTQEVVYYLPLNIETKIEGKGDIKVVTTARPGELIDFKTLPENGYELGEVKIYDQYNNEIFAENSQFIMPSSNVTIVAKFQEESIPNDPDLPENPATGVLLPISAVALGGIATIYLINKSKKKKILFKI